MLKFMSRAGLLVALTTLFIGVSVSAQSLPEVASADLAQRILAAHNRERALVGAPPLKWDEELARHAAAYGPVLASLGTLVHSPREGRPGERENLAMGWHAAMTAEQLVGVWAREKLLL
ncbi:MAG TPA: CAP domain-containing protein, partial [Sphingomicrobium sp.]|nr:CAP domain-containing protein [Sphingomicrobium sp.]